MPGAREINTQLFLNNQWYDDDELNVLLMQWGQFIAHDITLLKPDTSVGNDINNKYLYFNINHKFDGVDILFPFIYYIMFA